MARNTKNSKINRGSDGLLAGVVVLALGVLFLLNNTLGLDINFTRWFRWWPVVLILVGIYLVLSVLSQDGK